MSHRPPALARRQFLHHSLAGMLVGGCGQIGSRAEQTSAAPAFTPEQPMSAVAPSAAAEPVVVPGRAFDRSSSSASGSACRATEPNIEGPFYRPGAPSCSELYTPGHGVLASPYAPGTPVSITGRVLDRECRPLSGARIEIWHADHAGAYDHEGFEHRGRLDSGPRGEYRLDTIIPGHYLNGDSYRPAHIHIKVLAEGRPVLTTQLYFEGDPHNGRDPFIRPSLVMKLAPSPDGGKQAAFDFVV